MKRRIVSIVIVGAGLVACSNAWSWTMVGGKAKFSARDVGMCQIFENDAAVIILNRQEGYPLDYPRDADSPPLEVQKQVRAGLILQAQAIPIESTREKRRVVSEQFTQRVISSCLELLLASQPEDRP